MGLQLKIAYVTTQLPTQASGFGQRTMHLLDALRAHGQVDLVWCADPHKPSEPAFDADVLRWSLESSTPMAAMRQIIEGTPPVWARHRLRGGFAPDGSYDLLWFSRLRTWILAGRPTGPSIAVDFDDLSDELFRTQRALRPKSIVGGVGRLSDHVNEQAIVRERVHAADSVGGVFVCSERDQSVVSSGNCYVVPNGTDLSVEMVDQRSANEIVFVGPMSYGPNLDAARRAGRIVELLAEGAAVHLYGAGTTGTNVAARSVVGHGFTEHTDEIYRRAAVALIPLRAGAGTRLKVLEAMAYGVPVVATPFAVAGLDVVDGETALLAEADSELAVAASRLLRDPELRVRLATRGRRHVERIGSWERSRKAIDRYIAIVRGSM